MDVGSIHLSSALVSRRASATAGQIPFVSEKQTELASFSDALARLTDSQQAAASAPTETAPPGASKSTANDLLRMLGANNEGVNAAAAPDGQSSKRPSFISELLQSAGAKLPQSENDDNNGFASYMHALVQNAYTTP